MVIFGIDLVLLIPALMISATPVLLAAIGEAVVEKSGVLNLGVEGMMITGAVIGFIIALGGVDADSVANVDAIAPMVSTLIEGMSVALFTTLVGAVFHVWLTMCYQILATGTVNLANAIIEQAEAPGFALPNDIL